MTIEPSEMTHAIRRIQQLPMTLIVTTYGNDDYGKDQLEMSSWQ